jgi:hypothetical protein
MCINFATVVNAPTRIALPSTSMSCLVVRASVAIQLMYFRQSRVSALFSGGNFPF